MKKITALLLCAMLLVGLLAGCDQEKQPYVPTGDGLYVEQTATTVTTSPSQLRQQLTLVYYPEKSLNPYTCADYTNRVLFSLLYQPLFHVDSNYDAWPILCSGYQVSRDMKTYTFYVETATFSDGTLLSAKDVAASLQQAKKSDVYGGRLGYVSDISVSENNAVVVKLSTAYENFLLLLDIPILKASELDAKRPLGTGPYYLDDTVLGQRLVRRMDWWCQANLPATAEEIPLVEAVSNAQIRDSFEFGDVGLVCADPGSDLYVDFRSDYELWECENGIFLYLACNSSSAVFSNVALRQALTHAIDRDALVETYYRGFAQAATLPASPDSPYYNKALAGKYGYDAAAFTEAVLQAELSGASVKILVNKADSRRVRVAREIAQYLTDCGLNATTSERSGTSYTNALSQGNYDLHLGQTILSANMDLTAFYSTSGALCYGGLSDAAILATCREALENSGNYYTLYQMVMEDAMLCPILFRSYAIYAQRGVFSELEPARGNIFFYTLGKTLDDIYIS